MLSCCSLVSSMLVVCVLHLVSNIRPRGGCIRRRKERTHEGRGKGAPALIIIIISKLLVHLVLYWSQTKIHTYLHTYLIFNTTVYSLHSELFNILLLLFLVFLFIYFSRQSFLNYFRNYSSLLFEIDKKEKRLKIIAFM